MLEISAPGAGFIHFPLNPDGSEAEGFGEEFFEQLQSEKREVVLERGLRHVRWVPTRDRNEALDRFAMGLITLESLRLNLTEEMAPIVIEDTSSGHPGESQPVHSPYGARYGFVPEVVADVLQT